MSKQDKRLILVTGANRGIGLCVVKKLLDHFPYENTILLMGCRDMEKGRNALEKLASPPHVHLIELDMGSIASIMKAVHYIKENYWNQIDILINNAAILEQPGTLERAREVFNTNYYGIKLLNEHLLPIMKDNGRIINVSSQIGPMILAQSSQVLQEKYTSKTLTDTELDQLVDEFIVATMSNTFEELGYHVESLPALYGVSKLALNALTYIQARDWSTTKRLTIVSVSPGFCATDMTQNQNTATARSPELGADSIMNAILISPENIVNGGFYRDGQLLPFISKS